MLTRQTQERKKGRRTTLNSQRVSTCQLLLLRPFDNINIDWTSVPATSVERSLYPNRWKKPNRPVRKAVHPQVIVIYVLGTRTAPLFNWLRSNKRGEKTLMLHGTSQSFVPTVIIQCLQSSVVRMRVIWEAD